MQLFYHDTIRLLEKETNKINFILISWYSQRASLINLIIDAKFSFKLISSSLTSYLLHIFISTRLNDNDMNWSRLCNNVVNSSSRITKDYLSIWEINGLDFFNNTKKKKRLRLIKVNIYTTILLLIIKILPWLYRLIKQDYNLVRLW